MQFETLLARVPRMILPAVIALASLMLAACGGADGRTARDRLLLVDVPGRVDRTFEAYRSALDANGDEVDPAGTRRIRHLLHVQEADPGAVLTLLPTRVGHSRRNSHFRTTSELDRIAAKTETRRVTGQTPIQLRARHGALGLAALASLILATSGCGALLLVGGAGTSAIAFATGELRVTEEVPLADLHLACQVAVETLRYDDIEATLEPDRARWRATTAGGDPVDIQLIARGPETTDLRIRVGIFGNEARSRLVLEQIRQAL